MRTDSTLVSTIRTVSLSEVASSVGRGLIISLQAGQLGVVLDLRFSRATGGLMLDDVLSRETTEVTHVHIDITVVLLVLRPLAESLWFAIWTSFGTTLLGRDRLGWSENRFGWRLG